MAFLDKTDHQFAGGLCHFVFKAPKIVCDKDLRENVLVSCLYLLSSWALTSVLT